MGPSQICGCPFREPRVFTIAHIESFSHTGCQKIIVLQGCHHRTPWFDILHFGRCWFKPGVISNLCAGRKDFFWAGTCAVDNACARRKQRLGNKHHETHISPWPGLCIFLNFGAILAWNMIGPGIWHIAKIECAVAGTEALLSGNLPVRFTFIHFSTPARRKRSHSAALPEVITWWVFYGQVAHVGAVGTIPKSWESCHRYQLLFVVRSEIAWPFTFQGIQTQSGCPWNWGHKGGWHSTMWSSVLSGNTLWSWTSWTRRVADTTWDSDGQ